MSAEPVLDNSFSPTHPGRDAAASAALPEISNAMVRLYKEAFGRGPTKVRTMLAGADTVVVVLEDAFTTAERTLLALSELEALRRGRLAVQEALEERARSVVEEALRRRTVAFVTGVDPRHAIALNVFTMEPAAVEDGHQDGAALRAGTAR
jgi:uncharacterized protein YbcI